MKKTQENGCIVASTCMLIFTRPAPRTTVPAFWIKFDEGRCGFCYITFWQHERTWAPFKIRRVDTNDMAKVLSSHIDENISILEHERTYTNVSIFEQGGRLKVWCTSKQKSQFRALYLSKLPYLRVRKGLADHVRALGGVVRLDHPAAGGQHLSNRCHGHLRVSIDVGQDSLEHSALCPWWTQSNHFKSKISYGTVLG